MEVQRGESSPGRGAQLYLYVRDRRTVCTVDWHEGQQLVIAQGPANWLAGQVRFLGEVPVLEYEIGPMSGVLLLDSLDETVTIKVLDGCGHLAGDEGVVHCTVCKCSWCLGLSHTLLD